MSTAPFNPFANGQAVPVADEDSRGDGFNPFRDGAAEPVKEFDPFADGSASADEPEAPERGWIAQRVGELNRGVHSAGQMIDSASIRAAADEQRKQAAVRVDPNADLDPVERWLVDKLKPGGLEARAAERTQQAAGREAQAEAAKQEAADSFVAHQQAQEAIPLSDAMRKYREAEGFGGKLGVVLHHPAPVVADIALNSAPAMVPGMVGGAVMGSEFGPPGTAVGAFIGSFAPEYQGKVVEVMSEEGVDLKDSKSVADFLGDPARVGRAQDLALRKGLPIALVDALSAGFGGRFLKAARGLGVKRMALATAGEAATQAAAGAGGETLGEVAAGEKLSPGDILAEALAEIPGSIPEVVTNLRHERAQRPAVVDPTASGTPRRDEGGATRPAMAPTEDTTAPEAATAAEARKAAERADADAFVANFAKLLSPDAAALAEREQSTDGPVPPRGDGVASISRDEVPGRVPAAAEGVEGSIAERGAGRPGDSADSAPQVPAADLVDGIPGDPTEDAASAVDSLEGPPPKLADTIRAAQEEGEAGGLKLSPWQRLAWGRLAYDGAADVMERTAHPLGQKLAAAMRRHTDLADELVGRLSEPFEAVLGPANSLGRRLRAGSPTQDAPAVRQAKQEFAAYFRARENRERWVKSPDGEWQRVEDTDNVAEMREVLANASPLGIRLIGAWERAAELTGRLSEKAGVQVFDSGEKRWRPIGNLGAEFFPRRIRADVRRAINDPAGNPELVAQLKADLMDQGRTEAEAKAILTPGSEDLASSSDYMGNLEKGREGMLPASFYEYRFDPVVKGFIGNYSERLAQIASYGQKTTPDTADLFDLAERRAADSFTRRYVAQAREQAYGRHRDGTIERFMSRAGTFATGAMLSNPVSSLRNLVSGLYGTAELVGVERALDALGEVNKPALDMDAKQLGILRGNLLDAQFFDDFDTANDKADRVLRKGVELGLKIGGYTGTETFIRRHAASAAMQFVTDGVEDYRNNPHSRRSLEFLAAAQRLGLDGEKIAAEGLDFRNGMETRAFVRRQVKEGQGGYRFDQVPLWANSPAGRFLYQFGRWGTQRTRALYRSMWVPATFGTKVKVDGETVRVRNVRPLLLAGTGTVLVGSLFAAVADVLFDRERPDASWSEIADRIDADTAAGLGLAGDRLCNDLVTGGMLGVLGQPIAAGRELTVFNRVRNPLNPPGVQAFGNLMDVVYSALDEGGLPSSRALLRAAEAQFSGAKNAKEATLNLAAKLGADWDAARRYQAKQDQRLLRNITWRFAREEGIDATRGGIGGAGVVRRTATSAAYDDIQDALAAGDAPQARQLAEEYLWRAETDAEFKQRLAALRSAVRSRQPFRVGTHNGEALRVAFYDWARSRLPDAQLERILRVDRTYYEAALRSGLMLPRAPEEETVRRAEVKRLRQKRLQGKALEQAIERELGPRLKER